MQKRDLDMQVTPAIFPFHGQELLVTGSKECRVYLVDTSNIGGADQRTPLYRSPLMCNEEVNFASAGIWGAMASWEDSRGTRWVLTPFWGPMHPDFHAPVEHGPVEHGAIVAYKVEAKNGGVVLTPAWISRDMNYAEPPIIANGVVYAYGSGENTVQSTPEAGLKANTSAARIANSTHATLYALDAETGKELYSSGDRITSFVHFGGLRSPTAASTSGPSTARSIALDWGQGSDARHRLHVSSRGRRARARRMDHRSRRCAAHCVGPRRQENLHRCPGERRPRAALEDEAGRGTHGARARRATSSVTEASKRWR